MPSTWKSLSLDHAVARYRDQTAEMHDYATMGLFSAVGHAYQYDPVHTWGGFMTYKAIS